MPDRHGAIAQVRVCGSNQVELSPEWRVPLTPCCCTGLTRLHTATVPTPRVAHGAQEHRLSLPPGMHLRASPAYGRPTVPTKRPTYNEALTMLYVLLNPETKTRGCRRVVRGASGLCGPRGHHQSLGLHDADEENQRSKPELGFVPNAYQFLPL